MPEFYMNFAGKIPGFLEGARAPSLLPPSPVPMIVIGEYWRILSFIQ